MTLHRFYLVGICLVYRKETLSNCSLSGMCMSINQHIIKLHRYSCELYMLQDKIAFDI